MIKKIFAFGLAAVLALTPVQAFGKISFYYKRFL